jgi:hypothetical protein
MIALWNNPFARGPFSVALSLKKCRESLTRNANRGSISALATVVSEAVVTWVAAM